MGKSGISKKDGNKKKHNNLLKKKKNKELTAKINRALKLKELNRMSNEAAESNDYDDL